MPNMSARDKAADRRLRGTYGITLVEYTLVLKWQHGKCAICKRPASEFKNRLAVDHCHTTGLVRGLVCWGCNKLIAVSQDDAVRLRNAGDYLTNPPVTCSIGERFTVPGRVGTKKRAKLLLKLRESKSRKRRSR